MEYNIIVFVKQVPDTQNISGDAMKPDGTINRAALPAIFNPDDLNALELALELKDRYGAKITAATMGPPNAANVLRDSLFRGADEAVLLSDRAVAGSDTLATSFVLSRVAKTIGNYDLIICGHQAIDGDTAQVGPQIAEKLGLPQITHVQEIMSIENGVLRAKRNIQNGFEVVEAPLPLLLTVADANEPRPENAFRICKFKKAKTASEHIATLGKEAFEAQKNDLAARGLLIRELSAKDAIPEEEMGMIGFSGSPTSVKNIESVVLTAGDFKEIPATKEGVTELIHELIAEHTLG